MKQILLMITVVAALATSCKKTEEVAPSAPSIASVTPASLALKLGETGTVTLEVSAAGKLKDVTASVAEGEGTVEVTEITGKGETSGTATISYTSPLVAGTYVISVVVSDELGKTTSQEITAITDEFPPETIEEGSVEGTWQAGKTYIINGNVTVEKGKTLTIEEGVTVIVAGDGGQGSSPSFLVNGNLYVYGTADNQVTFTAEEANRTEANIFKGLWGGIQATEDCAEMVLLYTNIEYAGSPAEAGSPGVESGVYDEGEPQYGLLFGNTAGTFVMMNSRIAYTLDDGMRILGGKVLLAYNYFEFTGETGGESVNIKSGTVGNACFNTVFESATNGIKWSNSGDRSPQTNMSVYNNTMVNSGWRRTKTGRGGSVNIEKAARGNIYNNLIVNCKFGVRVVGDDPEDPGDGADYNNTKVGYSYYYGATDLVTAQFYPEVGILTAGDKETDNDDVTNTDPAFVNHTVTGFDPAFAGDPTNATFADVDLALSASSPAATGGNTSEVRYSGETTISADGKTYDIPSAAAYFGSKLSN